MKIPMGAALAFVVAALAGHSAAQTASDQVPAPAATKMTRAEAAAVLALSPEEAGPQAPPEVTDPGDGLISGPPPGKGQIVFFRNTAFLGWPIWYTVKEKGRRLGNLSNGAFFTLPVDPGLHVFTAATENKDTLHIEVEAGQTYYVRGTVYMGLIIAEAGILPSDEASFEGVFYHLHPAKTWPVEAGAGGGRQEAEAGR
jgi:hypothetical protein